jgi:hypothetical protein
VYAPLFQLRAFDTINDHAKGVVLIHLLEGLIAADVAYLLDTPNTPWLYESGVVYEEEPDGRDHWQDIPTTLALRVGDCEDLGSWRVAELRVRSREHAKPVIRSSIIGHRTVYHVAVQRADGRLEDPSKRLGMR